ncbi:MAG: hypothetical protein AB7G87_13930 [Clostridia bacterium]
MEQIIFTAIGIVLLSTLAYGLQLFLQYSYLCFKYGSDYAEFYSKAYIKKFKIGQRMLQRHDYIEFYATEDADNVFVNGNIIGLTDKNYIFVRDMGGRVVCYRKDCLQEADICCVKR